MKVFVNSIPKSGTNYVSRIFTAAGFAYANRSIAASSVTGRYEFIKKFARADRAPFVDVGLQTEAKLSEHWLKRVTTVPGNHYLTGHARYSERLRTILQENQLRIVLVYRRPEAVLHSWIMYQDAASLSNRHISNLLHDMNYEGRFYTILNGIEYKKRIYRDFKATYEAARYWLSLPEVIPFEFKGERVCDASIAAEDIRTLFESLQVTMSLDECKSLHYSVYGNSHTYRSANDMEWREFWNADMKAKFYESFVSE